MSDNIDQRPPFPGQEMGRVASPMAPVFSRSVLATRSSPSSLRASTNSPGRLRFAPAPSERAGTRPAAARGADGEVRPEAARAEGVREGDFTTSVEALPDAVRRGRALPDADDAAEPADDTADAVPRVERAARATEAADAPLLADALPVRPLPRAASEDDDEAADEDEPTE